MLIRAIHSKASSPLLAKSGFALRRLTSLFSSFRAVWQQRIATPCIELLSSMRFAVALLAVLALASVIGTILKQDANPADYIVRFGPFWADIFITLGLQNVYGCAWFLGILIFLVLSLSLCVSRKGGKMLNHMRSWKDRVRLNSLRTFRHHAQWNSTQSRLALQEKFCALLRTEGYRFVIRHPASAAVLAPNASNPTQGHTLIAAKRGTWNKLGYFATHLSIIVICLGGLLDSHLPLQAQKVFWGKRALPIAELNALPTGSTLDSIDASHRLSSANPTFRGYAWVPEKQTTATALINEPKGVFFQELPFTLELNRFIVEYYSTGMPKRFASEVTLHHHTNGQKQQALIEVNRPLIVDGLALYQSSFEDGGSVLHMQAYPLVGYQADSVAFTGHVNQKLPLTDIKHQITTKSASTLELTGFRAINVENMTPHAEDLETANTANAPSSSLGTLGGTSEPAETVRSESWIHRLTQRLGSGAKAAKPMALQNIGPSIQYKIRDQNGQASEFHQYMLPVAIPSPNTHPLKTADSTATPFFLAGVRTDPAQPFRYLRIPADSQGSLQTWMGLRAALHNPVLRAKAAQRFARHTVGESPSTASSSLLTLQDSAERVLALFAGASPPNPPDNGATPPSGGFTALANFVHEVAPASEQERAATLLLRLLEGAIWELWQLVQEKQQQQTLPNTLPFARSTPEQRHFLESSITALSELSLYPAPLLLQLESYEPITASVFQVTKMPGKFWVYIGSLFLLLGIVILFYVRERRIWIFLQDTPASENGRSLTTPGVAITVALSSPRDNWAAEREFLALKKRITASVF